MEEKNEIITNQISDMSKIVKTIINIGKDLENETKDVSLIKEENLVTFFQVGVFKSEDNLQRELDKCDNFIKTDAIDHIRFQLNIPIDNDHPEAIMNYVKERYKYNKSVKVNVVNGYIEEKKEQAKKEISEENKKYSFIYDETPMENKISYYIVIEKDKNIDPDTIYIYLNCSVEEIISKIEAD